MANLQGPPPDVTDRDIKQLRAVLALGGVPLQDLDDAMQQVRLKLLHEQERQQVRNPAAWTLVVVSRVAADWHRPAARGTRLHERLRAQWAGGRAPTNVSEDDVALALTVAAELRRLSPPARQVLVLRFYLDLPVRDIATVLQIPEGTVKSRLHAALRTLGPRLEGHR